MWQAGWHGATTLLGQSCEGSPPCLLGALRASAFGLSVGSYHARPPNRQAKSWVLTSYSAPLLLLGAACDYMGSRDQGWQLAVRPCTSNRKRAPDVGCLWKALYRTLTPDPKPQTPNPKPQTPNPKPQTPNPKPQTLALSPKCLQEGGVPQVGVFRLGRLQPRRCQPRRTGSVALHTS